MYGSESAPSDRKMILNSNKGVTNILESDVIHNDMAEVTNKLFKILSAHYGPYSLFAGVDPNRPLEDTIFTKDGANIIKNISFISPLEDIVRKAVLYIGENVEKSSGDGTTSSMMFMCAMLKHMNATLEEILPVSYHQLQSAFRVFLDHVKKNLEEYTMRAVGSDGKCDPEKVRSIVYAQAYTSSHGNHALAKAVADMFASCPAEMWPKMTFARRNYESDAPFEITKTGGQYELENCTAMSKAMFNKDAGRYLHWEDCTLVVLNDKISVSSPHWEVNVKPVLKKCDVDHPVLILARHGADDYSYRELMEFNNSKNEETGKNHLICVVWYNVTHARLNDLVNIQVIAGNDPTAFAEGEFTGIPCVVEHVNAKYEFDRLTLDGLYDEPRGESMIVRERPDYTNPERPYFRDWLDTIQDFIKAYEAGDLVTIKQKQELRDFKNLYMKCRYDKQIFLLIGGHTFDNLAMYDVVEDVIKAAINTLGKGAVVSNNKSLYAATKQIVSHFECLKKLEVATVTREDRLVYWFAKNTIASLNEFSDVVMDMVYPKGTANIENHPKNSIWWKIANAIGFAQSKNDNIILQPCSTDPVFTGELPKDEAFTPEERAAFRKWWFANAVDLLSFDSTHYWYEQLRGYTFTSMYEISRGVLPKDAHIIIQPANADIVMLERFAEIALKFILTERFVVCNAAYVKPTEKGKK